MIPRKGCVGLYTAKQSEFEEILIKLLPLIGATELIESLMQH
jgi:hypothetical protein